VRQPPISSYPDSWLVLPVPLAPRRAHADRMTD